MRAITIALLVLAAVTSAQTYKCSWCVNGIGGGDMAGTSYRCSATAGQTAAGQMTGTAYWALIGFWQTEQPTGIQEQSQPTNPGSFVTRLYAPQPNPARAHTSIRYTLDAQRQTSLQIHDLTGRVVRTLCASSMKRGSYSVTWGGTDDRGRSLANGIYFVRLVAGGYHSTEKLVLQK
ncbi:MAG TPA: FlgD immunoglobulin-like domain containing protein [bacterium]|nr:FlgD immunoglobulin-like domain containing protein [bacterium]